MNDVLISVCMITYNHEKFIQEAIEGVLMQKLSGNIELIISNDCSTDKTDQVISQLIRRNESNVKIEYTRQSKNLGMMANFIWTLQKCKGKYIAVCEGDDYWTDPLKLKKQINFLEQNEDYVLCFHNAEVIKNVQNKKKESRKFNYSYNKTEYTAEDLLKKWLIPTASMVYRNIIKEYPDFLVKSTFGDIALQVYLCEFGRMHYIDEIMSVYRINDGSITIQKINNPIHYKELRNQYRMMDKFFKRKYSKEINRKIFLLDLSSADAYKQKSFPKQLFYICRAVFSNPVLTYHHKSNVFNSIKAVGISVFRTYRLAMDKKAWREN